MSKNHDQEWLKARTVHVKGIPPEDRSGKLTKISNINIGFFQINDKYIGNFLRASLERVLAPTGGQVLGVILVPDFVN